MARRVQADRAGQADRILEQLKQNSRASYKEIAKKIGTTEATVRRKIMAMEKDGTITAYTIETPDRDTNAIVLVSASSESNTASISSKLGKIAGVKTVYEITGQHDIAVILGGPGMAEINSSIDRLRKVRGVADTHTVIILRRVK